MQQFRGLFVYVLGFVVLFTISPRTVSAQETVVNLRFGLEHQATYRVVELFQKRGRVTVPAIGYIDFGRVADYRELIVGAGYDLLQTKALVVTEGLSFVQSAGASSHNTRYLQPWTEAHYRSEHKFEGEIAVFPYIPLNSSAHVQLVIERAKLEYRPSRHFKAGAGYGADKFRDERWEHKPFLTATITLAENFGSPEIWLQKLPHGGSQIQLRYELVRSKHKE